jgi:hypothetical protein
MVGRRRFRHVQAPVNCSLTPQTRGLNGAGTWQACRGCRTAYGEGRIPTDAGPITCVDCGGAGTLATEPTLLEWRLRALERAHAERHEETSSDIRWLIFELRRAREALTELVSLADDVDDVGLRTRVRFIANRALELYAVKGATPDERQE